MLNPATAQRIDSVLSKAIVALMAGLGVACLIGALMVSGGTPLASTPGGPTMTPLQWVHMALIASGVCFAVSVGLWFFFARRKEG